MKKNKTLLQPHERIVLRLPGAYRLLWQERQDGRWRTVRSIEVKESLSRRHWHIVCKDQHGVHVGHGSWTQIFRRLRELACNLQPPIFGESHE